VGHLPGQVDLTLELHHRALVLAARGQDRLERDALVQLEVLRLVELTHPSPGEEADDAEAIGHDVARAEHGRFGVGGEIRGRQFEDPLHVVTARVTCVRRPGCGRGAAGDVLASDWPTPRRLVPVRSPEQPGHRDVGMDTRDDLGRLERPGDEIDGAGFESPHLVLLVVEGGKEDHRRVGRFRVLLQPPARLVPVDPRHRDFEQHEERPRAVRDLERVFAATGDQQTVATAFEGLLQHVDVRGVAVHEEDRAGVVFGQRRLILHPQFPPFHRRLDPSEAGPADLWDEGRT
jgi:hypothetical protein